MLHFRLKAIEILFTNGTANWMSDQTIEPLNDQQILSQMWRAQVFEATQTAYKMPS